MKMPLQIVVFWFRRDLRLADNAGLYAALTCGYKVLPLFIFDQDILDKLDHQTDKRISFIVGALNHLNEALIERGTTLQVFRGKPLDVFNDLIGNYTIMGVYTNEDYEPYAIIRDKTIADLMTEKGIPFLSFKDHVIFDKNSLMTSSRKSYMIFTPYSRKWKDTLRENDIAAYPLETIGEKWVLQKARKVPGAKNLSGYISVTCS
jgi:deoxyribodipyrimidine photo-lyase